MSEFLYQKNHELLQHLMTQANIADVEELSRLSGVSIWQLNRLQYGLITKMQLETLLKIATTLKLPLNKLIETFVEQSNLTDVLAQPEPDLVNLQQEYQKLQQQLSRQQELLYQEFQQESIQTLESWLLQWPTAAVAVHKNPQLSAEKLLPLVKPVEHLLQQWGIEAIASVGEELPYDPIWHELMKGSAQPGEMVKVRYVGYKQRDKLLYRARVSPLE
ncbi:transcriptional regulator, XRE family [Stanieria cyanosphaera PCC 7437]|uniref:Transcriptional regulator, XRE family n=1 Tax=Stanieria cyanosphaera (strain ATCC 29371 / PCC 7437) TaxID=111780 RepID=K9XZ73_STAC7|nr:helix-turn-helix domain-containing protein [Stanieria cyanosphaera]AFZ37900.1 transcriptional regulator, XRE family [Stanieria cyanosphaera PCC 7437]